MICLAHHERRRVAQRRLHLQISVGSALVGAKGHSAAETSAAFLRARELANRVEDASERFSAYYSLWTRHQNRGEPAPMREMASFFLREATARPDCPESVIAHRLSGLTYFYFGDFAGAHQHVQKTIELYDQARHADFANRFGHDPREPDPFSERVYEAARRVGWGCTTTYGTLAKELGAGPEAARDVGKAMARNPVALIIPCHRVLVAGGKVGGFSAPGGSAAKRRMLALEGVQLDPAPPAQQSFRF